MVPVATRMLVYLRGSAWIHLMADEHAIYKLTEASDLLLSNRPEQEMLSVSLHQQQKT